MGDVVVADLRPPEGRQAATSALFEAYYVRLVWLARRLLVEPADAEDVVMDAFIGLYRRWDRLRRPDDAFFYLRASVVNGSHNRARRLSVARARAHLLTIDETASVETGADHDEHRVMVDALRRLSTRQRQVLVLRYYEELSEAEIAATLGCGVGSVKTHAARGLKALAAQLGEPT